MLEFDQKVVGVDVVASKALERSCTNGRRDQFRRPVKLNETELLYYLYVPNLHRAVAK